MKYILTLVAAVLLSAGSYSQAIYSLDYTMSFGVGDTKDYISSASFRGLTFEGRGFVSDNVTIGGLFTWTTFYEKLAGASFTVDETRTITGTQYRYINAYPLMVQAHYYLSNDKYGPRVYLGGGLGTYKVVQRTNIGVWSVEDNNWHFGFAPEVGVLLPLSMDTQFNISFKYNYVVKTKDTNYNQTWFGLNLGFAWGD